MGIFFGQEAVRRLAYRTFVKIECTPARGARSLDIDTWEALDMSRNRFVGITAAVVFLVAATTWTALPQGKGLLTQKVISADMAITMAQAALAKCRADKYHVSVHVIDVDGLDKVAIRDDGSGEVNFTVSKQKAFTALTYKRPSSVTEKAMANISPAAHYSGYLCRGRRSPHQGRRRSHRRHWRGRSSRQRQGRSLRPSGTRQGRRPAQISEPNF